MERLKALRKSKGLSMKELGRLFGLSESTISLYESGKRQPDNETILKIADFFDVSVDYLLGREEKETPSYTEEERKLFGLIEQLTDAEVEELSNYLDYLLSKRK